MKYHLKDKHLSIYLKKSVFEPFKPIRQCTKLHVGEPMYRLVEQCLTKNYQDRPPIGKCVNILEEALDEVHCIDVQEKPQPVTAYHGFQFLHTKTYKCNGNSYTAKRIRPFGHGHRVCDDSKEVVFKWVVSMTKIQLTR